MNVGQNHGLVDDLSNKRLVHLCFCKDFMMKWESKNWLKNNKY